MLSLSPILSPVQVGRGSVQSAVGDDIHSSSTNLSPTPISVSDFGYSRIAVSTTGVGEVDGYYLAKDRVVE